MTQVIITNNALKKLGVAPIVTVGDQTRGAITMALVYNPLLDFCLSQHAWTFAKKTVRLTPLATLWASNTSYQIGGYTVYSGTVYKCLVAHVSTNFTADIASAYWSASNWVTATVYASGAFVNQGGNVYVCVVPHTSGTFATDLASVYWVQQSNLTVSVVNFGDGVNLAYAYPSDWIKPNKWNFPDAIRRLEDNIYCDTPGLAVKYTYRALPAVYSPEFIEAFATKLAAETCYDLTNNVQLAAKLLKDFDGSANDLGKLAQAIAADSQSDTVDQAEQNEWLIARLAGGQTTQPLPGAVTYEYPGPIG